VTDKHPVRAPEATPLAKRIMLIVHLQEAATLASPRGKTDSIARPCILADGAAELLQTAANHGESCHLFSRRSTSYNPSPPSDHHTQSILPPTTGPFIVKEQAGLAGRCVHALGR